MKLLLAIGCLLFGWYGLVPASIRKSSTLPKQQGVCWVAGHQKITERELEKVGALHINWISQTPFGWQAQSDSPIIRTNTSGEKIWWGESDEGIIETTRLAHSLHIKTLLKPHIWVSKGWAGDVSMENENDWKIWFSEYEAFILHYAALAERNQIDLLCIGTELQKTSSHEKEWRDIIKKIRTVYHGPLTYAANFYQEFETIAFWDQLDFVGVQAYFSLSKNKDAKVSELILGWQGPLTALEKIHIKYSKPVIFTEIGYRSTHDAAVEPWRWPQAGESTEACLTTQAACYQAFFDAVWNKKWMAGVYFWKWYPDGPHRLGAIDFTPQEKPAAKVILENFSK